MSNNAKNILKCVIALALIAFVCVAVLAVANVFLTVVPTLDEATAQKLNAIAPSGVDDATAYGEGYYKLYSSEELSKLGFDLNAFNKSNGTAKNKVVAVYRAEKGDSKGAVIIESTGNGYYDLSMLIAFNPDGTVRDITQKTVNEDALNRQVFNPERFEPFRQSLIGKSEVQSQSEIEATTGASTKSSIRGLHESVSIACKAMAELKELDWEVSANE